MLKVTIECTCGEKFVARSKATYENPNEVTELDMYLRDSDYLEGKMVVFECEKCTKKLRIKLNEY